MAERLSCACKVGIKKKAKKMKIKYEYPDLMDSLLEL
jgi:hypothetical protein